MPLNTLIFMEAGHITQAAALTTSTCCMEETFCCIVVVLNKPTKRNAGLNLYVNTDQVLLLIMILSAGFIIIRTFIETVFL